MVMNVYNPSAQNPQQGELYVGRLFGIYNCTLTQIEKRRVICSITTQII